MDTIYSIGFTKKTAKYFFESLKDNGVELLIDVRLNSSSQLAGFAKATDLDYFLQEIANINYIHEPIFAPTKQILDSYRKKNIDWEGYTEEFNNLMIERKVRDYVKSKGKDYWVNSCLLCSEVDANQCHRRLAINLIQEVYPELKVIHIV